MNNDFSRGTVGSQTPARPAIPTFQRGHVDLPEVPEQPAQPAQPDDGYTGRRNKFGAKCVNCGVFVPENQGRLESVKGKWETSHIPPCPEAATEPVAVQAGHQPTVVNGEVLYDGTYTLERLDGHRTFRLRTQATDADFMPGVQIIEHLTGPDNTRDFKSFGHLKGGRLSVWKRHQDNTDLVADAQAFMKAPQEALVAVACYRCGRELTVPASVHDGLGPECSKRGL